MPTYQFKAISATGQNIEGKDTAASRAEILQRLREKQQYPLTVEEVIEKDIKDMKIFGRVKTKQIAVFCRQFYTMMNAGVTVVNSLDILRQQVEHRRFKESIQILYEDVQKGATFSEALEKQPHIYPSLLIHMAGAGEASGSLDTVMQRMSVHYEQEFKINNKIKSAMVYPAILSVVSIIVVIFLLTVVMPTFVSMFEGSGVPLPLPTRILIGISNFLQRFWWVLAILAGVFVYLTRRIGTTPGGRKMYDRWKLRLPLYKSLSTKIVSGRFCRTMSTMLSSGIPLMVSLESVAGAVGNTVVGEGILSVREDVRKGVALSIPIRRTGLFPPMVDNMIKIGEESGTLDDILDKTANFYDEEVEVEIQRLLTFVEPGMIIIMGVIIGFIVISMMMPMFNLAATIG